MGDDDRNIRASSASQKPTHVARNMDVVAQIDERTKISGQGRRCVGGDLEHNNDVLGLSRHHGERGFLDTGEKGLSVHHVDTSVGLVDSLSTKGDFAIGNTMIGMVIDLQGESVLITDDANRAIEVALDINDFVGATEWQLLQATIHRREGLERSVGSQNLKLGLSALVEGENTRAINLSRDTVLYPTVCASE
jgi:hypothetical protein